MPRILPAVIGVVMLAAAVVLGRTTWNIGNTSPRRSRRGNRFLLSAHRYQPDFVIEYFPASTTFNVNKIAFHMSGFSRGFPSKQDESISGAAENSVPAKCMLQPSTNRQATQLSLAHTRGHAVARLLIGGTDLCVGWLAVSAKTIGIQFMAECKTQIGCKGTMEAKKATFVINNKALDCAVLKLPEGTDMSKYGFLQVLASGPLARERIYIPQHPTGWAKHFATIVDCDGNAVIKTRGTRGPCVNNQVFYSAATQGGSSGSPVFVATDNKVAALHHCGSCCSTRRPLTMGITVPHFVVHTDPSVRRVDEIYCECELEAPRS